MNFTEEVYNDVIVEIVNVERATIKYAEEFKKQVLNSINNGFFKVVVDLSNVEFIDSSFLGVLVRTLKRTVQFKGDLKLVGLQPAVRSMFELTRMLRVFDSFDNTNEAINSFSN